MSQPVTTTYLEMLRPEDLRAKAGPPEFQIVQAKLPCPEFNRFLYESVGRAWQWTDKLAWSYEQWERQVADPNYSTWVGYLSGTPAGYFELDRRSGPDIEIAYFGLMPQFIGQGLGGPLLTSAIENAWRWGARRVWVHTCTLDHPSALANYLARGLRIYKEERSTKHT